MKRRSKKPRGFGATAPEYDHRPKRKAKRSGSVDYPKVAASQFAKNFGECRERAMIGPIAVTNHGRTTGYFISALHFEEFLRVRTQSRRAVRTVDLPRETIDAIRKARVPKKYDYLNALLDED